MSDPRHTWTRQRERGLYFTEVLDAELEAAIAASRARSRFHGDLARARFWAALWGRLARWGRPRTLDRAARVHRRARVARERVVWLELRLR